MTISLPPLAELTPAKAAMEFAQARYMLSKLEPDQQLPAFAKITTRFARAQLAGLLPEVSVVDRVIEAAEATGLVETHGFDTIQNVLVGALETAEQHPSETSRIADGIRATLYVWKDPAAIRRRDWLYGHLLIRKFLTATISPGGTGKSSLIAAEALAMVSGKPLLGVAPVKPLSVWLWNLEDPQEETERKVQAAALRYGLTPDDIAGRLYVDSGRDQPLVMATTTRNGTTITRPVVDNLIAEAIERRIDVIVIDPFVSCHEAAENDNGAMDMIAKEWGKVADRCNCAVHLVHHTRKGEAEVTTESSRGGKALTDACRVVRAVNRMTKEEAERAGVENNRLHYRTINDKANLAPPVEKSDWFKLESVDLGNGHLGGPGDSVGVVTTWEWPSAFDGVSVADLFAVQKAIAAGNWRQDFRSSEWVGAVVIETLSLDPESEADRTKTKSLLKTWIANGALKVVRKPDETRRERSFVEVGTWANA